MCSLTMKWLRNAYDFNYPFVGEKNIQKACLKQLLAFLDVETIRIKTADQSAGQQQS